MASGENNLVRWLPSVAMPDHSPYHQELHGQVIHTLGIALFKKSLCVVPALHQAVPQAEGGGLIALNCEQGRRGMSCFSCSHFTGSLWPGRQLSEGAVGELLPPAGTGPAAASLLLGAAVMAALRNAGTLSMVSSEAAPLVQKGGTRQLLCMLLGPLLWPTHAGGG